MPQVAVRAASRATLRNRLWLTGSVEPTRLAHMASPVEGPIVACPVREGDRVRAGALLVRLGRTRGDAAAVAAARATLAQAQVERKRIRKLVDVGALPGEALDRAKVEVSAARAELARRSERLGDYRIVAPWRGVVSRMHVAVGAIVGARASLVEIFDPESLVFRFAVPGQAAARVQKGDAVEVRLDAHPGRVLSGQVVRVYPEVDRQSRTRTLEAELQADVALAPGMFGRVVLTLATVREAVAVPVTAVLRPDGSATVVFVITSEGRARRRRVRTGIEDGDRVQILSGLSSGERVAVAGHGRLRDGVRVRLAGGRRNREGSRAARGSRAAARRRAGRPEAGRHEAGQAPRRVGAERESRSPSAGARPPGSPAPRAPR